MEITKVELTEADKENLKLVATAKSAAGGYLEFERVVGMYGRWGRAGCAPRALQCPSKPDQKSFAITDSMMLYIEAQVCALRNKTSEAPDLYLAFKLQYLIAQSGPEYEALRQKYRKALHSRNRLYSVRGRQRDAAAFLKRLRKGVLDGLNKNVRKM